MRAERSLQVCIPNGFGQQWRRFPGVENIYCRTLYDPIEGLFMGELFCYCHILPLEGFEKSLQL